jgi:hypothetical protein
VNGEVHGVCAIVTGEADFDRVVFAVLYCQPDPDACESETEVAVVFSDLLETGGLAVAGVAVETVTNARVHDLVGDVGEVKVLFYARITIAGLYVGHDGSEE